MKKLLFVFELHRSREVADFFKRNVLLMHERGYQNIGYEMNQKEAERVLDPANKLIDSDGAPSSRQLINDLFMANNPRCRITGLDVPELNELNRFILNWFHSDLFEKIHFVRDFQIFHQARKSSESSGFGSVNLVGCNHVGIMHQLIAYAVREKCLSLLEQCKFVFLVETGYPIPKHLFGTDLPAYPLDALVIDTKKGLAGTEAKLKEYLDRPVTIPSADLLSAIQQKVDGLTQQQTQFYQSYCLKLFHVYNCGQRHGITAQSIMLAGGSLRGLILELAKHTAEAVDNGGKVYYPVSKISKSAQAILIEAGFQFSSPRQEAMAAYRAKQFDRAAVLFEQCLEQSKDPDELLTIKYNLASTCREMGKVEKALNLFHEVIVHYHGRYQKEICEDGAALCKYMTRYFDLLNAHPNFYGAFEEKSREIFDLFERAHLQDEALLASIKEVGVSKRLDF